MKLVTIVCLIGLFFNILNIFYSKEDSTKYAWFASTMWCMSALINSF